MLSPDMLPGMQAAESGHGRSVQSLTAARHLDAVDASRQLHLSLVMMVCGEPMPIGQNAVYDDGISRGGDYGHGTSDPARHGWLAFLAR